MRIKPSLHLFNSHLILLVFAANIPPENIISDCPSGSNADMSTLLNNSIRPNCLQKAGCDLTDGRDLARTIMEALQRTGCHSQTNTNNSREIARDLINSNIISDLLRSSFESYLKNVLGCDLNTDSEEKCLANYRNRQLLMRQPAEGPIGNTGPVRCQSNPNPPVSMPIMQGSPVQNIIPRQTAIAAQPAYLPTPIQHVAPKNTIPTNQPGTIPCPSPSLNQPSNYPQAASMQAPMTPPSQPNQPSNYPQAASMQAPVFPPSQPNQPSNYMSSGFSPQQPYYPNNMNSPGNYLQYELAELDRIRRNRSRRRRAKIEISCICLKSRDGLEDCKCKKIKEFRQKH